MPNNVGNNGQQANAPEYLERNKGKGCRRRSLSCCLGCSVLMLIFVIALIILGFIFVSRYESWLSENREFLSQNTYEFYELESEEADLERKLDRFSESAVEKETLDIDCEELSILTKNIVEDHWEEYRIERLGTVCSERSVDIYVRLQSNRWVILKLWQRAEGSAEFVVYDIKYGPFSLGTYSFGYITGEFNKGIKDGMDFLSKSDLMGREIVELYVEEDEIRIVGKKN
jgi:hypothetical protein